MRQIKTIVWPASQAVYFDREVNGHIVDGWKLKKRKVLDMSSAPSEAFNFAVYPALYAELEREEPPYPEEVTN